MAVWQHYLLLEEVALTRWRINPITLLRIVRRGRRERGGDRNDHHLAIAAAKSTFSMTFSKFLASGSYESALRGLSPLLSTYDR
jgi:hypothetical protein